LKTLPALPILCETNKIEPESTSLIIKPVTNSNTENRTSAIKDTTISNTRLKNLAYML
jgi:hypothetical protein